MVALPLGDRDGAGVTLVRRLDHVAIVVKSTADALRFYEGDLGLRVQSSEEIETPPVRLTYVDAGNAFLQLVEPLDDDVGDRDLARGARRGIAPRLLRRRRRRAGCQRLERPRTLLSSSETGVGASRRSSPTERSHGVRIECTEFDRDEDVDAMPGWLEGSG